MTEPIVITDDMVERLARFLQDEWAGPYMAHVRDYLPHYQMGAGPERDRALAELQAADQSSSVQARRMARRALEVALGVQDA